MAFRDWCYTLWSALGTTRDRSEIAPVIDYAAVVIGVRVNLSVARDKQTNPDQK